MMVLAMSQETDAKVRQVTTRYEREAKEAEARAQRPHAVQRRQQQQQVAAETQKWMR
jgi:hypothetical protein